MRTLLALTLAAEAAMQPSQGFPLLPIGAGDKGESYLRLDEPGAQPIAAFSHNRGTLRVRTAKGEAKLPRAAGEPGFDSFMGAGLTVEVSEPGVPEAKTCKPADASWLHVTPDGGAVQKRIVCRG